MKVRELIIKGYKCGLKPPHHNPNKVGCLTTELAHRTNSYGLPHIIEYETQSDSGRKLQQK